MSLQKALIAAGYEPQPYSGRGMCGRYCLGVAVDSMSAGLFEIGKACAGIDAGTPAIDNLGRGFILYWPQIDWVEGGPDAGERTFVVSVNVTDGGTYNYIVNAVDDEEAKNYVMDVMPHTSGEIIVTDAAAWVGRGVLELCTF